MFNKFKAWLERLVAEFAAKHVAAIGEQLKAEVRAEIKKVYSAELAALLKLASDIHDKLAEASTDLHNHHITQLGEATAKYIEEEVQRFRDSMSQTAVEIKQTAAPSQWVADADTVKADHLLRNPAPQKKRKQ